MILKAMGMIWFSQITRLLTGLIGFISLFSHKTSKGFTFGLKVRVTSGRRPSRYHITIKKLSCHWEVLGEYRSKIELINEIVLKALARLLNLEEDCFLNQYGTGKMEARFNYYPPCPWPEKVLVAKPHADGSVITVPGFAAEVRP